MFRIFGFSSNAASTGQASNDSVQQAWNQARNAPNGCLIGHIEYWQNNGWGTQFPSDAVKQELVKAAQAQNSNVSITFDLQNLSVNDLKDLYDILNTHVQFGGSDRPENGAVAKKILEILEGQLTSLPRSNLQKAQELLQALNNPSKSNLGSLKAALSQAIENTINPLPSESELTASWEGVKGSNLPNRGLLGHTDYHFPGYAITGQQFGIKERNLLLQFAQVSNMQDFQALYPKLARLSALELVTVYRLVKSHAHHGINHSTDGVFAGALEDALKKYISETLPQIDNTKAGHAFRIINSLKGHQLEQIRDAMLPRLNLVRGPCGGIYTKDYWAALNAYQFIDGSPTIVTPETIRNKGDANEWRQMEANYKAFMQKVETTSTSNLPNEPKIPKKIHLIWLGAQPDATTLAVRDSWIKHHQPEWEAHGWEVKLWGNDDAAALIQEMREQYPKVGETWDKAVRDDGRIVYAEKADVLRYCILAKFGGLYADSDLPCFDTVADLHYLSDFYVSMEQNNHPHCIYVGNALMGAKPNHPHIIRCLEKMKPRERGEDNWAIIGRTGPGLITDQIYTGLREDRQNSTNGTLVLGPSYFYPLSSGEKDAARGKPEFAESRLSPWSKGLHLWNLSWG